MRSNAERRFRLRDCTTMHTCIAQTEQIPSQIHLMDPLSYAVALPRTSDECDSSKSGNSSRSSSNTGEGPSWNRKSTRTSLRQCSQPARSVMIACRIAATLSHHQASSPALIFISAAPVKLGLGRSFPFSARLVTLARGRKSTQPPVTGMKLSLLFLSLPPPLLSLSLYLFFLLPSASTSELRGSDDGSPSLSLSLSLCFYICLICKASAVDSLELRESGSRMKSLFVGYR